MSEKKYKRVGVIIFEGGNEPLHHTASCSNYGSIAEYDREASRLQKPRFDVAQDILNLEIKSIYVEVPDAD